MQQKIKDIKTRDSQRVISWEAPEEIKVTKSTNWYIILLAIALGTSVFFYFVKLYAGMALALAVVLFIFSQNRAKVNVVRYTITTNGVNYKDNNYPFDKLKSFWIANTPPYPKLYLRKTGKFSLPMVINMAKVAPKEVEEFLRQYLPESSGDAEKSQEMYSKILKI